MGCCGEVGGFALGLLVSWRGEALALEAMQTGHLGCEPGVELEGQSGHEAAYQRWGLQQGAARLVRELIWVPFVNGGSQHTV